MRTLVTGGAGFIGSALVERLLAEGHTVDVVDNLSSGSLQNLADARSSAGRDLTFHQLDVRSPDTADLVSRRQPEVVWHLAGQTSISAGVTSPAADAHVNIVGTLALLEGVRSAGVRKLIVTSSAAVYGEVRGTTPTPESASRRPVSPHGVAKHAVDSYLAVYASLESIVFTSLVLGTVYGPRAVNGVVADWAQCLVAERPCSVFGDGKQIRDFVYVDDVVDALARAAGRGDGMVLNIGTGRGTSLAALHALMVATAGRLAAEAGPEPEEPVDGGPESERQPDGEVAPPSEPAAGTESGAAPEPEAAPEAGAPPDAPTGSEAIDAAADADSEPASRARAAIRRGPPLGLRQAPARAGEVGHIVLDPSRAAKALQWAPWTDLPTGIEAVLRSGAGRKR